MHLPGRKDGGIYDVTFIADNLPPSGVTNYYVQAVSSEPKILKEILTNDSVTVLDNGVCGKKIGLQ